MKIVMWLALVACVAVGVVTLRGPEGVAYPAAPSVPTQYADTLWRVMATDGGSGVHEVDFRVSDIHMITEVVLPPAAAPQVVISIAQPWMCQVVVASGSLEQWRTRWQGALMRIGEIQGAPMSRNVPVQDWTGGA